MSNVFTWKSSDEIYRDKRGIPIQWIDGNTSSLALKIIKSKTF
ncbi:MAG TPA: hypothetical protein PKX79_07335 [Spirochaetota bacterium]|nr:hypothetical protein [Spirochaetota bacterium]